MIEIRNTIGARVGRAIERTFRMDPEDFDAEFRRWLRKKYLPELVETGEPADFGRPFRVGRGRSSAELSPAASPSGDLVAAFSTAKGEIDVVLFDARERELLRNLTKGWSADYQYFVVQDLAVARRGGSDLVFSPDGNTLAFFARQDRGRKLVLIDVLKGKIVRSLEMEVEQQVGLSLEPGRQHGSPSAATRTGRFDIFEVDVASGEVRNLTTDDVYDAVAGLLAGRQVAGLQLGRRRLLQAVPDRSRQPGRALPADPRRVQRDRRDLLPPTAGGSTSPRIAPGRTTSTAWSSRPAR